MKGGHTDGGAILAEQRRKQIEAQREQKKHVDEMIEEWGFQNEETKRMFEARFKKAKGRGKKKR